MACWHNGLLAAAFCSVVALAGAIAAAQDVDRSAEFSAALSKVAWEDNGQGDRRLVVRQQGGPELVAYQFPNGSYYAAVVAALDAKGSTAKEIHNASVTAELVVNGGYFDREQDGTLKPTGLLISEGKTLSPLTACRACSGALWAEKSQGTLHIDWANGFTPTADVESAIQTGPLLVEPGGKMGINKPGGPKAQRSSICLLKDKFETVIVVAVTSRITLYELATLLQKPAPGGFGCERAINLDGGPSTQIASRLFGGFLGRVEVHGTASSVQNFIAFYSP